MQVHFSYIVIRVAIIANSSIHQDVIIHVYMCSTNRSKYQTGLLFPHFIHAL